MRISSSTNTLQQVYKAKLLALHIKAVYSIRRCFKSLGAHSKVTYTESKQNCLIALNETKRWQPMYLQGYFWTRCLFMGMHVFTNIQHMQRHNRRIFEGNNH